MLILNLQVYVKSSLILSTSCICNIFLNIKIKSHSYAFNSHDLMTYLCHIILYSLNDYSNKRIIELNDYYIIGANTWNDTLFYNFLLSDQLNFGN